MANGVRAMAIKRGRCARAMGLRGNAARLFDPYRNDADLMALVKKFYLLITPIWRGIGDILWTVTDRKGNLHGESETLNHAIINAVAQEYGRRADSRVQGES